MYEDHGYERNRASVGLRAAEGLETVARSQGDVPAAQRYAQRVKYWRVQLEHAEKREQVK